MSPAEFIKTWKKVQLGERQAAQSHFNDLCDMLGQEKPAHADPEGVEFCFEKGTSKRGGSEGWADVWKKGHFAWEYKGKHKDLKTALTQLEGYRVALENPPLLVVCDLGRIEIHTNFTNSPERTIQIPLEELGSSSNLQTLRGLLEF